MARPKNSDLLKRDVAKIRAAHKFRTQEGYDELWKSMVDLYRGKHYKRTAAEDRMLVNLAFATKNIIAPSVAVNNPRFTVNARKPESMNQAVIAEQVLNYLWRTHNYKQEFRLAVDDFLVMGHGWLKCGYRATKPAVVTYPNDDNEIDNDDCGVDDREPVPGNVETEVRSFEDDDRPFVERISPFDVYVDPDATHPKYMTWIAQRVRRNVNDVRVDERYDPTMRRKITSAHGYRRVDDENRTLDGQPEDTDVPYVDVYEFYDLRKNTVSTFVLEMEEGFLIAPQKIPFAFGQPFVMLRNYEVNDTFYPMGELEAIEVLQYELNATRTQQMNHRKRNQRKYLYREDAFDDKGIKALQDDKDNVLVPVKADAEVDSLADVLAPMPQLGVQADLYSVSDVIENDIQHVTGVSDYMQGGQTEIRRTATEAAMIQDAQNARASDKLANIESTLATLGQRVVQLMQQFMTGDRVVRIVGMQSAPMWIQFDSDFIKGEFDFEVEGGSTQPRNESFRRQSAQQFMDAMIPFLQMGVANPVAVMRKVLMDAFDVKDVEQFVVQQPQIDPATGQPAPGAPGMAGAQPGAPAAGADQGPQFPPEVQATTAEEAAQMSPIPGIPPEMVAQLMGQTGLDAAA